MLPFSLEPSRTLSLLSLGFLLVGPTFFCSAILPVEDQTKPYLFLALRSSKVSFNPFIDRAQVRTANGLLPHIPACLFILPSRVQLIMDLVVPNARINQRDASGDMHCGATFQSVAMIHAIDASLSSGPVPCPSCTQFWNTEVNRAHYRFLLLFVAY
ncbi:hypothetical protein BDZ89DRAFT_364694 [Hymenopellis radicata]|nr:hypothetical protein BDZ89DRAFT_364694 [Hymenopellis radicata]